MLVLQWVISEPEKDGAPVPGSPGLQAISFNTSCEIEIAHKPMQSAGQLPAGALVRPQGPKLMEKHQIASHPVEDFQAGPRDPETGFPIGGNASFVNTVELRFPLVGENLGGVLFNDMGNVYSAVNKISLRFTQRDLQDFDYAVQAFGFGIRYRTPIGPVRVDFSLSPNSPRFFGFQGTENQLLYGGGTAVTQRINVFQFHFSLGQAF